MPPPTDRASGSRAEALYKLFLFVPPELILKCRQVVERHHRMYGFATLADVLWQSSARTFILADDELRKSFDQTSRMRRSRLRHDILLSLAAIVLSVEVLYENYAGWGSRFPNAKFSAEALFATHAPKPRVWLMDIYVYQRMGISRHAAELLAP